MKKFLHNKGWGMGTNPAHVGPPLVPLVKEISTGKSDGNYVTLKLCRDTTSITSNLYEFRMSLFGHGDPGKFILFVQNF